MGKTKIQRDQLEVLLRGGGRGVQAGAGVGGTWDVLRLQKDSPPPHKRRRRRSPRFCRTGWIVGFVRIWSTKPLEASGGRVMSHLCAGFLVPGRLPG